MNQTSQESDQKNREGIVFLDYTQSELDHAYNQRAFAPNSEHVRKRLSVLSKDIRLRNPPSGRHSYGTEEIEQLDIYSAGRTNSPVNIYIHGGAWRKGSAAASAYLAEVLTKAGSALVVPDFYNVEQANDSLRTMVSQVRSAIAWVYQNSKKLGLDGNRIYVSAHSSGAHLAACTLITDWVKDFGLPADILKGAFLCSGMYDLRGPRLSARSSYVKFDDPMEEALSPQRHVNKINTPVILAYGTQETPEFQRQAIEFASTLELAGKQVELIVGHEYNHYEIRETFANPYGLAGKAILSQMKLS